MNRSSGEHSGAGAARSRRLRGQVPRFAVSDAGNKDAPSAGTIRENTLLDRCPFSTHWRMNPALRIATKITIDRKQCRCYNHGWLMVGFWMDNGRKDFHEYGSIAGFGAHRCVS